MCTPTCIYFPETKEVLDFKVIDGVKYCTSYYRCGYSQKRIKNWEKCHRKGGPITPNTFLDMFPAKKLDGE